MRSKLTLSVDKETIKKAKSLAEKKNSTVSGMFSEYIELQSEINQKLTALNKLNDLLDTDIAAEPDEDYDEKLWKKHGW